MDFLGAVNRVLVNAYILKGDDDLLTNFNDNQHEATLRVAKQAIQTELNSLMSAFSMNTEKSSELNFNTVIGQLNYVLPSDFVRFWGDNPFLWRSDATSDRLYEYPGGEQGAKRNDPNYYITNGKENWWYWLQNNRGTKEIGLYPIPDGVRNYYYHYERDTTVTNSTDTLPFQSEAESQAFADMASRRFVYMVEQDKELANLEQDTQYLTAQGTLMNFMRHRDPDKSYGKSYR